MHQLRYRITTLSPVIISADHGDVNMVATHQYIPGSSVLGLMAKRYLRIRRLPRVDLHSDAGEEFRRLFLTGDLRFGNAHPAREDRFGNEFECHPTPFSIRRDRDEDSLLDLQFAPDDYEGRTKPLEGFSLLDEGMITPTEVDTQLNFHHQRDHRGIPAEGQFFTYESLAPDQVFRGSLFGEPTVLHHLETLLGTDWEGHIGNARSAQYGTIRFELLSGGPAGGVTEVQTPAVGDKGSATLTLLSDTIIYNEHGYATTDIAALERALGARVLQAFVKASRAANYIGVWQLKRPEDACFAAGSSFRLDIGAADPDRLAAFQESGLGERTREGFGRCVFGLQAGDFELIESKDETPEPAEPEKPMPRAVRSVVLEIAMDALFKEVGLMALEKLDPFLGNYDRLPSSAQIKRLEAFLKVRETEGEEAYGNALRDLKDISQAKLNRCDNGEQTLLEFIGTYTPRMTEILQTRRAEPIRKIFDKIGGAPGEAEGVDRRLHALFFRTFFSRMRKAIKARKEG